MKVERIKSGYYKVEGAKYIRIETGYITDTRRFYELNIRSIDSTWKDARIFHTHTLETLKKFLAQYETEKDLIADYYIARLVGKHELIYIEPKYRLF